MKIKVILFLLFSQIIYSQINTKILISNEDASIVIRLKVKNDSTLYVNPLKAFIFILSKRIENDTYVSIPASKEFFLNPYEEKVIELKRVTIEYGYEGEVHAFIRSDSLTIGKAFRKISSDDLYDGIEIKGLVTENTITRFGKNFYDIFYQEYLNSGIQYPFSIDIKEKPALGGFGSLISLEVDNDIIYQFRASLNNELLTSNAIAALSRLKKYNKTKMTVKNLY